MATSARSLAIQRILEAEGAQVEQYVDLAIEVRDAGGRSTVLGGRWDTAAKAFEGSAQQRVVITLTPAQQEPWRECVLPWLRAHLFVAKVARRDGISMRDAVTRVGFDALHYALLYGGRRGGKSHLALLTIVLVCVALPGARCAIVSPTKERAKELRMELEGAMVPVRWRHFAQGGKSGEPDRYTLINGSEIEIYSGMRSELKIGKLNAALLNEAQELPEALFYDLAGCIADTAGLVIAAANPPRRAKGLWVQQYHRACKYPDERHDKSVEFPGNSYFVDKNLNPHKYDAPLQGLKAVMTAREYQREIDGDIDTPIEDLAMYAYSDAKNCIVSLLELRLVLGLSADDDLVDITGRVTERSTGYAAMDWWLGADFDLRPGCAWSLAKIFARNAVIEEAVMVFYAGGLVDGIEEELSSTWYNWRDESGKLVLHGKSALVIADASMQHQDTLRDRQASEKRTSWNVLERHGWRVVGPDDEIKTNPRLEERFALHNAKLCNADKQCSMFFLPGARELARHHRELPNRPDGRPDKKSKHCHPVDATGYPVWRLWGEQRRTGIAKTDSRQIKRGA